MRIKCSFENLSRDGFSGSLKKLQLAIDMADSYRNALPSGIGLADEFRYQSDSFQLVVVEKGGTRELDASTLLELDQKIVEATGHCVARRTDANKKNTPIQKLETDSKYLQINKSVHAAVTGGVEPQIVGTNGQLQRINSVHPRDTTVIEPAPEPILFEDDFLISGSNVVGTTQLELFAETHVDIVFFLTGAKYHEVRLRGPLGMASVVNMATRMRGRFVRSSPKDRHLTCEELPTLYATP